LNETTAAAQNGRGANRTRALKSLVVAAIAEKSRVVADSGYRLMRRRIVAGDDAGVMAAAMAAAPYCDPKLVNTQINVRNEYANVSDEELTRRIYRERQAISQRMLEATGGIIEVEAEPDA
jgi:hypothetical protein